MELLLKKYFWVIHVVVIVTCSILLAKGVNHYLEAKVFVGDKAKKPTPSARPAKPIQKDTPHVVKDPQVVVDRNIFCSTCEPPKPVEPTATSQPVSDPNHPPATSLPLVLMATSVAH